MKRKTKKPPFPKKLVNYVATLIFSLIFGGAMWMQQTPLQEIPPPSSNTPAALYANQNFDDLTKAYSTAIDKAEKSVLLMIYSLTDQDVIQSLKKARARGVDVKVISDAKASPSIDMKLGGGISITRRFGPGLMHIKILVVDDSVVWLGSANMTSDSLKSHGNLVTAFNDTQVASTIKAKASSMKVEGYGQAFPFSTFNLGGQKMELWFLPDNKNGVQKIKQLIQSAKKTIRVAMFTWTRQDFAQEIIAAKRRGVDTEVVIDNSAAKGAGAQVFKLLKNSGVKVALSPSGPLLHHKFLYIDGEVLVNGSANWTKAAFSQNDDCFIILYGLTPDQRAAMEKLWSRISKEAH